MFAEEVAMFVWITIGDYGKDMDGHRNNTSCHAQIPCHMQQLPWLQNIRAPCSTNSWGHGTGDAQAMWLNRLP